MANLSRVTIGIKSFMRFEKLHAALDGIEDNLPECSVIVVDDSFDLLKQRCCPEKVSMDMREIQNPKIRMLYVGFDWGFGYKSNVIAMNAQTQYLLISSDDFDHSTPQVRKGIEELVRMLDTYPEYSIASGRVNGRRYEFFLQDEGHTITEVPIPDYADMPIEADLTVNYSLIRKEVFDKVYWDNNVKIGGGEHGAFFVDCKRAGFKTIYVPGVNITTLPGYDSITYRLKRNRAKSPERPCFVKRGIKKYVLGDGRVDYNEFADCSEKLLAA